MVLGREWGRLRKMTDGWQTSKAFAGAATYVNKLSVPLYLTTKKCSESRLCVRQRKKFHFMRSTNAFKCAGSYF